MGMNSGDTSAVRAATMWAAEDAMKGSCSPSSAITCAMTNNAPYTAGTVSSAMP